MDSPGRDPSLTQDLEATVKELSHTYEELSLLYRLSEVLSGMTVDEIAEQVVEETIYSLDVRTAALLLYDETSDRLSTKSCKGDCWDKDTVITRDDVIFWSAIEDRKPLAFCRLYPGGLSSGVQTSSSVLVCPLIGKAKVIGAIVLANKGSGDEFFSNDIKLMMAIASYASITIENAMLYKELEDFFLSAILSLVKALEASSWWTAGHTERVTQYAIAIGSAMGLSGKQLERLRVCSLLHDIGKIAIPKQILDKPDLLTREEILEIKKHPQIGAEILGGFKQLQDVILGIKFHHIHWDGSNSSLGLRGEEIPLLSRILAVADAFDAMTSDRPYRKRMTEGEAVTAILNLSGKQFDPSVTAVFKDWVSRQHPDSSL